MYTIFFNEEIDKRNNRKEEYKGGKRGLKNYCSSFPSCCWWRYQYRILRTFFAATHVPVYAAVSHFIEIRKNLLSERLDSFIGHTGNL